MRCHHGHNHSCLCYISTTQHPLCPASILAQNNPAWTGINYIIYIHCQYVSLTTGTLQHSVFLMHIPGLILFNGEHWSKENTFYLCSDVTKPSCFWPLCHKYANSDLSKMNVDIFASLINTEREIQCTTGLNSTVMVDVVCIAGTIFPSVHPIFYCRD